MYQQKALNRIIEDLYHISLDENKKQDIFNQIEKNGWSATMESLGYYIKEYDYLRLAGRMLIEHVKNQVGDSLNEYIKRFENLLKPDIILFMKNNYEKINLIYSKWKRDECTDILDYDWFSANSIVKNYLTKDIKGNILETPLQMWLRISIATYYNYSKSKDESIKKVERMFDDLCGENYIPASPTIFNSGFIQGQLASCFLLTVEDDLDSIFLHGLHRIARISKNNAGVGIDISRLRHSAISNKGESDGLIPWVYNIDAAIRSVNQGGKRKGACTVYCRPHHIDIFEFSEVSLEHGDHYTRAYNINTALWMPNLFWERCLRDQNWSLFCPNQTRELNDIYGEKWEEKYEWYEKNAKKLGIKIKIIKARELSKHITEIQRQTGMPYILNCDSINFKSNQKNLGYIRCSNLCLEICEYTSTEETAVCNLSSINLRNFVKSAVDYRYVKKYPDEINLCYHYDFSKLGGVVQNIVENLNQNINNSMYPIEETRISNLKHRPMGIGVQGYADMLYQLNLPFQDLKFPNQPNKVTSWLNKILFACIYWNALAKSVDLSIIEGKYSSFDGSPISKGKFQFDLWAEEYKLLKKKGRINDDVRKQIDDIPIDPKHWNQQQFKLSNGDIIYPTWNGLRRMIIKYGLRNSLLVALMPTATSSQPFRNCETTEAHQTNIYSRKVLNGAYPIINRHMVKDLKNIGLWDQNIYQHIQNNDGSLSQLKKYILNNIIKFNNFHLNDLPILNYVIHKYKTMWELSSKIFMKLAADRARYICQSQSLNIYIRSPTEEQLIAVHTYGYQLGLKTGMYYLRTAPATNTIKLAPTPTSQTNQKSSVKPKVLCNDEVCLVCQ